MHHLTTASVAGAVTRVAPGNFLLGYREGGTFSAFYVGRADDDLGNELRSWVGASSLRSSSGGPCGLAPWRADPLRRPAGRRRGLEISAAVATPYTHFVFLYAPSARAAFERQCRDYHELVGGGDLDNAAHPVAPSGSAWHCPVHA